MSKISIKDNNITIIAINGQDYICLTDMVRGEDGSDHIKSWMRNRNTVEFLGLWETLNNPTFKGIEFDTFRKEAGLNSFSLTPKKWIEATNAIGITSKAGKLGGTYAHKDIAFEFGTWISPEFKLLLIREFQRLKEEEQKRLGSEWDYRRFLSKTNYKIHTDAIKEYVLPALNVSKDKEWIIYANEADILNIALFGCTAKEWKEKNASLALQNLNIRDVADAHELIVLSNLENLNAAMIQAGTDKLQRLFTLRKNAEFQLKSLKNSIYTLKQIQSPFHQQKNNKPNLNSDNKSDEKD